MKKVLMSMSMLAVVCQAGVPNLISSGDISDITSKIENKIVTIEYKKEKNYRQEVVGTNAYIVLQSNEMNNEVLHDVNTMINLMKHNSDIKNIIIKIKDTGN